MNVEIFCKYFTAHPDNDTEMNLHLYEIDKDSLLESVTERFTLAEILADYDKDFVREVVRKL